MTTSSAEEELIRKAGTQEKIRRKAGSRKSTENRGRFVSPDL
jgi:hypothetical protein